MDINRQIAQHRARIATMQREAVIGGLITVVLATATLCSFAFQWHPVIRALLLVPTLGMLAHAAAPYSRIKEHRKKLVELEAKRGGAHE